MNRNDELIGQLEDYLDSFDGATPLPRRVRDAIHAELPRTRQVRARPRPMEVLTMATRSTAVRLSAVAAAIVVAFVLGAAALNGSGPPRSAGPPPATPTPTPAPTPSPTPAAGPVSLGSAPAARCDPGSTSLDCIAAGTYTLTGTSWPAAVSLDVPGGWFAWDPGPGLEGVLVDSGADAPGGSGWGLMFSTIGSVPRDPCNADSRKYDPGDVDTAAELAAVIGAWPGFKSTKPVEVTVDSDVRADATSGLLVEVTSKWTEVVCPNPVIWTTAEGAPVDAYPMVGDPGVRRAATFRILEVGDQLLVIRTTDFGEPSPHEVGQGVAPAPTRHAADRVELQAIIDSVRLEPSARVP